MRSGLCPLLLSAMAMMLSAQAPNPAPASNIVKETEPLDPRLSIEMWPEDKTFVEANTLIFNIGTPLYDAGWGEPNSQRMLALLIKPGEKLKFRIKAEDNKVALRAYVPEPPPAMKWRLSLENANRLPWQVRTNRFSIKNESPDPHTFVLIIYGAHGNSYHVDLEREAK